MPLNLLKIFFARHSGSQRYLDCFVDTTNGCNLSCLFCTRMSSKIVSMSTEQLDRILAQIHTLLSTLQLSCAWEYSIAKNAAEIIRTVGKYKIPTTSIYTNGNILTDDIINALFDAEISEFVVSIGEAKKETYEKLRNGGKFERVLANIRKLSESRESFGARFPVICSNLTLVNSNISELVDFVDLANSVGIQRIVGRPLILNEGLDISNEVVKDGAYANDLIDKAKEKAVSYGMTFTVPKYEDQIKPKSCRAPWEQLYIASNGDVSVCPRIHVYEQLGNLLAQTLDEIVNGSEIQRLREQFEKRAFTNPVCGICMENRETECAINQGF